ncbi:putative protein arginine N-methyltransferase 6 [Senna tora]|uniref:Protein arginine methyltransferase 6 n=1 Tax=Senna tora TaxID=362788 RepID=A0A834WRN7_9FABA|nr:putative protein arginine N-methyltransferase 6 [Senna tora]
MRVGMGHRERTRRVARRSRESRDGAGSLRVCEQQQQQPPQQQTPPCTDFDLAYFHSYAHVGIHEEMIKDRVRTETYRAAIMQHQSLIAGKVVVDVGCGTGILSIFCAQAGAKRVYAVDASDIAQQAKEIVKANKLSDVVIVMHGRVEDVEIDEEVDVIISEWMGYMLLYESMLGSVITARDRWLKPGGLILPSNATLEIADVARAQCSTRVLRLHPLLVVAPPPGLTPSDVVDRFCVASSRRSVSGHGGSPELTPLLWFLVFRCEGGSTEYLWLCSRFLGGFNSSVWLEEGYRGIW